MTRKPLCRCWISVDNRFAFESVWNTKFLARAIKLLTVADRVFDQRETPSFSQHTDSTCVCVYRRRPTTPIVLLVDHCAQGRMRNIKTARRKTRRRRKNGQNKKSKEKRRRQKTFQSSQNEGESLCAIVPFWPLSFLKHLLYNPLMARSMYNWWPQILCASIEWEQVDQSVTCHSINTCSWLLKSQITFRQSVGSVAL